MLYTEEAVRAGLRVRDGRRVFYLPEGSRLTPAAREAVDSLFPADAAKAFDSEYRAYDPDDEDTSLIPAEIEKNDAEYAEAMQDFDFYKTAVEMIIENLEDFC